MAGCVRVASHRLVVIPERGNRFVDAGWFHRVVKLLCDVVELIVMPSEPTHLHLRAVSHIVGHRPEAGTGPKAPRASVAGFVVGRLTRCR